MEICNHSVLGLGLLKNMLKCLVSGLKLYRYFLVLFLLGFSCSLL